MGQNAPFGKDFFNFFANLLPFISLMILFFLNFVNDCEIINNNIWYKITTIFSLMIIIYMQYRSVFDNNMILWHKTNYHINFDYFNGQLSVIKFMVYGLCVVNILFVIEEYLNNVKKENNGLN